MKRQLIKLATIAGAMATLGTLGHPAAAQSLLLEDGNSSVRYNFTPSNPASVRDLETSDEDDEWRVEGIDNLFVEDFFFNLGGANNQPEFSLGALNLLAMEQTAPNRASLLFANQRLAVRFDTQLQGGAWGSGLSNRYESLTLYNLDLENPLELSFFKYFDFDVLGSARAGEYANDTTQFLADGTLLQSDPSGFQMLLTSSQTPDRVAIAEYPELLMSFDDLTRTVLDNDTTPLVNTDGTVALQFNRTIAPMQSVKFDFAMRFQPREDVNDIPEPAATVGITLITAGYLLGIRRLRKG